MKTGLQELAKTLEGDLFDDVTMRTLYATDASAYREMPAHQKKGVDQAPMIQCASPMLETLVVAP